MSKYFKDVSETVTIKLNKNIILTFTVQQSYRAIYLIREDGGIILDGYVDMDGNLNLHSYKNELNYFITLVTTEIKKVLKLKK